MSVTGATRGRSLSHLILSPGQASAPTAPTITLKRFSTRIRHKSRGNNQFAHETRDVILSDQYFQNYVNYLKGVRGNNGNVSPNTLSRAIGSVWNFLDYTGIPITNHALTDLIEAKRKNPTNTEIEQAIVAFANEQPINQQSDRASFILAIFKRGNFTPLMARVNTHFEPKQKENCSWKTFLAIYAELTEEQKAMIQWGLYVPQRAVASYHVPLDRIELEKHPNYALVTIEPTVGINKARVRHPCFVPIDFAREIVRAAEAAGRTCPFPNHQSEWKKITALAKEKYGVHLLSKNLRKFFEKAAHQTRLRADFAAFVMGDKTKLNASGHMPLIYDPDLMEAFWVEEIAPEITKSGIIDLITLSPRENREGERLRQIQEQIESLQEEAQRLQIQ